MTEDKLRCGQLQEVKNTADMNSLPNNAVIFQQRPAQSYPEALLYNVTVPDTGQQFMAAGANFGANLSSVEDGVCSASGDGLHGEQFCNLAKFLSDMLEVGA